MAAEGTAVVGGGVVGGRLAKDSLGQAKLPNATQNRRRSSSLSRDAERRAYQWCREYLGGAWRRVRPEELRVCPVRWEVKGQLFLCVGQRQGSAWGLSGPSLFLQPWSAGAWGRGGGQSEAGAGRAGLGAGLVVSRARSKVSGGRAGRRGPPRGLNALNGLGVGLQRRPQQSAVSLLAPGPPAQRWRGAPGGAATAVWGHSAGERG